MNLAVDPKQIAAVLARPLAGAPVIALAGGDLIIRAGTTFRGFRFLEDVPIVAEGLQAGDDYFVILESTGPVARPAETAVIDDAVIGGFHFAPGGNAAGRSGGDSIPEINPCSIWDLGFRPACPDPRGMTFVMGAKGPFWCDVYLLGRRHVADGTSRFGVTIADGNDPPERIDGSCYPKLDYATAMEVMARHGKGLLSIEEFMVAAYGVTERTSQSIDPRVTGLDAARTSKYGLQQASGNLWIWGHDGDPDEPRASLFGGSWCFGDIAGSRQAYLGDAWPVDSFEDIGARGRCDHLAPE